MRKALVTIPELHPSINVWKDWHWRDSGKEKIRWAEMIGWLAKGQPKITGKAVVRIDWYFKTKARHDYDNYTPKFILDGLVTAGIIEDDSSDHIDLDDHNFHYDKNNPRTEITIYAKTHEDFFEGMGYDYTEWISCEWCGGTAVDVNHIEPRGMGGKNKKADVIENLVGMCRKCHLLFEAKKIPKEELTKKHLSNVERLWS